MSDISHSIPSEHRVSRLVAAIAFALAMISAMQPAALVGQIEVDVLTTPSASGSQATTITTATPAASDSVNSETGASGLKEDRSADDAARRIVPAPGTAMQSTEGGTLQTGGAVATEPSVRLNEDEAVLQEGETTETVAVRSGVELLRMLGVQREAKSAASAGGLEMDENTSNTLFDMSAVKRLKGDEPTVVYRVVVEEKPLPDPMIVPWIRQAKLLQERFDKAVQLLGDNKVDEGRMEMLGIITDFPDSDHALQATAILAKLDDMNKEEAPAPVMDAPVVEETTVTVEISPNISVGTVMVDPANVAGNRAMIGGKAYRIGEAIWGEAGHRVISISDSVVQIEVEQSGLKKTFDLPVRPTRANN